MNSIFEWIGKNTNWIFDGIGVAIIGGIIGIFAKKKYDTYKSTKIIQKGGKGSINIQNNNIGSDNDE